MINTKLRLILAGAAFCTAMAVDHQQAQAEAWAFVNPGSSFAHFSDPTSSPPHGLAAYLYFDSISTAVQVYAATGDHVREAQVNCTNGNVNRWVRAYSAGYLSAECLPGGTALSGHGMIDDT